VDAGKKPSKKKMPESLLAPLAAVASLTHQQAGHLPKEMVALLMAFLGPWAQESTLRSKMKKVRRRGREGGGVGSGGG
jgi:hypothetical protein